MFKLAIYILHALVTIAYSDHFEVVHNDALSIIRDSRLLATTVLVSSENDLITAFSLGTNEIEFSSDITLTMGLNVSQSSLYVYGNNFTLYGASNGMKRSCLNIYGSSFATFQNLTIYGCGNDNRYTLYGGGAMLVAGGANVKLIDCAFISNKAFYGGGLYVDKNSQGSIIRTLFSQNVAMENGGAVYAGDGAILNVYESTMISNYAGLCGGAIALYYATDAIFSYVNISYNEAFYEGGAMVMVKSIAHVSNCDIMHNVGANSGGIGVFTQSGLQLLSSNLMFNHAMLTGGALSISGSESTVNVSLSDISHNISPTGGGVSLNGGHIMLSNSYLFNNSAFSSLTLSLISGSCSVGNGCFYSGNYPSDYSNNEKCIFQPDDDGVLDVVAFFTEPSIDILTIDGQMYSGFDGPSCVNVSKGQNITWETSSTFYFSGFEICLAELISGGGAIYVGDGTAVVTDSFFVDNTATRFGGTLQVNGGTMLMYNSSIISHDHEDMPPINFEAGTFTATDLVLTGAVDGTSAVVAECDSSCGGGKVGNCSTAGTFAPYCQVNCECIDCDAGTFSDSDGSSTDACRNCPSTYMSYAGSSSCDIAAENYYIDTNGTSQPCSNNAYCAGLAQWPRPVKNYWVNRDSLEKATEMHRCHRDTCIGAEDSEASCWLSQCYGNDNSICGSGCSSANLLCMEGSEGPLCGSCSNGYSYSSSSMTCLKCDLSSMSFNESIFVFSLCLMLLILISSIYFGYISLPQDVQQLSCFTVTRNVISSMIRHSDSGALRVLWVNYQILDSVSWTLDIAFPSPYTQFLEALHIFSLDFFIVECLPGGFLSSVYLWSIFPLLLAIINGVMYKIRIFRLLNQSKSNMIENELEAQEVRQERRMKIEHSHVSIFLFVIFTLLPPVARKQYVALDCFRLQDEILLRVDTSVNCESQDYLTFRSINIVMILIYMSIPMYWVWLLYCQRSVLNPPSTNEYRRVIFIGVLPLMSARRDRRAALGVFFSLCSLELFRNVEPFRSPATNLLAYVAQYAVLLTFGAALMIDAGIGDGLSDLAIGSVLLLVNVSVFGVAITSASIRFIEEQKNKQRTKSISTNKVEWACEFSDEKFKTTFDAIVEHSVPPSSCLVFWYTDMNSAKQALKAGIPSLYLEEHIRAMFGDESKEKGDLSGDRLGGVLVSLHGPADLDDHDKQCFPMREAVLACSIPRRWLSWCSSGDCESTSYGESGLRLITSIALQALRGTYFGHIEESKLWFDGGIFLPPKAIRRAYQLQEQGDVSLDSISSRTVNTSMDGLMRDFPHHNNHSTLSSLDSLHSPALQRHRTLTLNRRRSSASRGINDNIISPRTCLDYIHAMNKIRNICSVNGWAMLYHYTQPAFCDMISKTGFRMSTQGQGDGGVYFSTRGPASYCVGTSEYERNIIVDCYGESRLDEFKGKHKLDLVIVYGILPQVLSPAPGGRDNAAMVRKSDFEAMTYPHEDGNYFLRPDRILGMFHLGAKLQEVSEARHELSQEVKADLDTKDWISEVQRKLGIHDIDTSYVELDNNDLLMSTQTQTKHSRSKYMLPSKSLSFNFGRSNSKDEDNYEGMKSVSDSLQTKTVKRISSFGKLIRSRSMESVQGYVGVDIIDKGAKNTANRGALDKQVDEEGDVALVSRRERTRNNPTEATVTGSKI